ncbi:cytochrome c family protein [Rhodovarius crocodyli]|uniref:Cytochrome c family protein n=1 Tax=Rhodovarius crocodyli TaxID=1979269 RepID=A0A437MGD6_9PROT|nr:cytochrome c family protein [Rhodovarius crocodyli]RVT96710.1 cytochrome c family protein [Rhodovarius crocodyli]
MANLEMNKIFAAPLVAGVVFMGAGFLGELLVHPNKPHETAIHIQGAAPAGGGAAAPAAPPAEPPIGPLLANANVDNGRTIVTRQCGSCHTFTDGGRNAVGPNLYGIVNRDHAAHEGFSYSTAMRGKAGHPWDYEALNNFLAHPAATIPGTRMAFAGIRNIEQRADVIAYLRSLAANPAPLP